MIKIHLMWTGVDGGATMNPMLFIILVLPIALLPSETLQAITLYESPTLELYSESAENDADNDHPVLSVDIQSLAQLLASLQVRSKQAGERVYLMNEETALNAAQELSHALRRVNDDQDIHMVIYRNVGGLLNTRRFATGIRVFSKDGYLNLIFGQVDRFQDEFSSRKRDRKLPLAGSRDESKMFGGTVPAQDWFWFNNGREDWVLYPMPQQVGSQLRLEADTATSTPPRSQVEPRRTAPASKPSNTPSSRSEARSSTPDTIVVAPISSDQPELKSKKQRQISNTRWQNLEEGLETLARLREKGLIDEEEFQSKRRLLLDSVTP